MTLHAPARIPTGCRSSRVALLLPRLRTAVAVGCIGLVAVACVAADRQPSDRPSEVREFATPSAEATGASVPSPDSGGTYIALGDSLAVGVGASAPARNGYVGRVASALPGLTLRSLAIGGETSSSFIAGGQLALAIDAIEGADPAAALVTLDIGGNDLLRLLWTEPCASSPASDGCRQLVLTTVMQFEENYRRIVADLTEALARRAPSARLAVVTYFNPFSGTDAAHESAADLALLGTDGVIDCERAGVTDRGMNDVIACVGQEAGAVVVDVHPAFAGLGLELTHVGSDDIHANDRGYEVIADAIVDALAAPAAP